MSAAAPGIRIEGLVIVCEGDCLSAADGSMPAALRNDADWAYFQDQLDRATLVVTGRLGHEAHPNKPGRRRLVFSSSANGLEDRGDGLFWFNPQKAAWALVERLLLPVGGTVAVTGGTRVFDWFLAERGFDAFHLSRAIGFRILRGRPVFTGLSARHGAEGRLRAAGLAAGPERILDAEAPVTLRVFTATNR